MRARNAVKAVTETRGLLSVAISPQCTSSSIQIGMRILRSSWLCTMTEGAESARSLRIT